jgi:uridine phosphorylase
METISHTDLLLNPDGSIYHLHLLPGDIAGTILLVGDPRRVEQVSVYFDRIEVKKSNREFVTHTGIYKKMRLSVLSTGIGTDNMDIVVNELDALANVDLERRRKRDHHTALKLIRLGTCGALQPGIKPGSTILSRLACGFDGLYHFYADPKGIAETGLSRAFIGHTHWRKALAEPYFVKGSGELLSLFEEVCHFSGITISAPGFYAPQMRSIRLSVFDKDLLEKITSFRSGDLQVNNFEMECSALYALSSLLGHQAVTLCVAVANRITNTSLEDYLPAMDTLIQGILEKLATYD